MATSRIRSNETPRHRGSSLQQRLAGASRPALLRQLSQRRGVYAQPASQADIQALHAMLDARLTQPIASPDAACAVQQARPNSIWSIHAQDGLIGGVAFLPLNGLGLYNLIYGRLNLQEPDIESIAVRSERPAILYLWAMVARGSGIVGLSDILDFLDTQAFRHVDIWTRPVSQGGERLAIKLGFEPFGQGNHVFYKYDRSGP